MIFLSEQVFQKGTPEGEYFEHGPSFCYESCLGNLRTHWGLIDSGSLCCTALVKEDFMICGMAYASTLEYDDDQGFLENYDGYRMHNVLFTKPNWPFLTHFLHW